MNGHRNTQGPVKRGPAKAVKANSESVTLSGHINSNHGTVAQSCCQTFR